MLWIAYTAMLLAGIAVLLVIVFWYGRKSLRDAEKKRGGIIDYPREEVDHTMDALKYLFESYDKNTMPEVPQAEKEK